MGTNFYVIGFKGNNAIEYHIGKRSGAGFYCYACGICLEAQDACDVHTGEGGYFEACPVCGCKGSHACSFTWTMMRHKQWLDTLIRTEDDAKVVIDEYGNVYSAWQFIHEELMSTPMEFQSACEFS